MRTVQYISRATEKAYVAQTKRQYIFFVPMQASKQEIAKQISAAFKVTVVDVRVATRKGKQTKYSKGKHAYPGITYRRDHKIAYITVKEGDKIPVFDDPADAKKEDTKAEKTSKKAEKSDKKVAKVGKKSDKPEEKQTTKVAKKTTKKVATKAEKETK